MNHKYSEGPYTFSRPNNFSDTWISIIRDKAGLQIAQVRAPDEDTCEANARLLAASWALLEVSKEVRDCLYSKQDQERCKGMAREALFRLPEHTN